MNEVLFSKKLLHPSLSCEPDIQSNIKSPTSQACPMYNFAVIGEENG